MTTQDRQPGLFSPFEFSGEDGAGRFLLGMLVAYELWQLPVLVPMLMSLPSAGHSSFLDVMLTSNDQREGTALLLSALAWISYVPWLLLRRARALGPLGTCIAVSIPTCVILHVVFLHTAAAGSAIAQVRSGWEPLVIWLAFLSFALPPARTYTAEISIAWSLRWATAALLSISATSLVAFDGYRMLAA